MIASSGNSFTSASARLDYTIGEVVTTTLSGGGTTLTQGFHQPEIKFTSTENYADDFTFTLYPNPTEQFVTVASSKEDQMQVHVYDASGRAIMVSGVFSKQVTLDLQGLASGSYLMMVATAAGMPLHTYTVIKKSTY